MVFKTATDVDDFIVCGRLFHACGPAKAKARLPNSDRGFATTRLPADEERSRPLPGCYGSNWNTQVQLDTMVRDCVGPCTP